MSAADLDDAYDANTLFDLWVANRRVYGVRKLWHAAKRAGHGWGRDRVARLMRIAGIDGAVRGKRSTRTTECDESAPPRQPDLIDRGWSAPTRPDQWWVADFTDVWTLQGFCYVAFCVDVFSRRILGWRVMTSKTTALVTSVIEQALFTRRYAEFHFTATGLVHHSDAGSQYTSIAFTEALREAGIAGSIGSVGDALDNALMESDVGLYKSELIDQHPTFTGRAVLERETASWVHWYNTARLVNPVPTPGRIRAALPSSGHLGRGGVSRGSPAVPGRFKMLLGAPTGLTMLGYPLANINGDWPVVARQVEHVSITVA